MQRHITHFQYTLWPDHGVPDDASDFLELVRKVREVRSTSLEPVIVHCRYVVFFNCNYVTDIILLLSAGIGRTGVLIMMETAICLIEANEPIYPIELLKTMRDQRALLIQTADQFDFVCSAIYKVYIEGIVKPSVNNHHHQSFMNSTTVQPTSQQLVSSTLR